MISIEEQKIKNALHARIDKLWESDVWQTNGGHIGLLPDYITELMTEAAFTVLLAVKDTHNYRDENPPENE